MDGPQRGLTVNQVDRIASRTRGPRVRILAKRANLQGRNDVVSCGYIRALFEFFFDFFLFFFFLFSFFREDFDGRSPHVVVVLVVGRRTPMVFQVEFYTFRKLSTSFPSNSTSFPPNLNRKRKSRFKVSVFLLAFFCIFFLSSFYL